MLRIFLRKIGMFCWDFPINTEGFIQDRDASIGLWMIEVITLVLEDCCFWEDSEAMGKALRDEELDMIIFSQALQSHVCRRLVNLCEYPLPHQVLYPLRSVPTYSGYMEGAGSAGLASRHSYSLSWQKWTLCPRIGATFSSNSHSLKLSKK